MMDGSNCSYNAEQGEFMSEISAGGTSGGESTNSETSTNVNATNAGTANPEANANGNKAGQDASKLETEKLLRKFKVKVEGQELEVPEDELISNYQLRKASDKRFQEAMQARKQSEEFIRLLKTDPVKVLNHPSIGLDAKKWAEEYLISEMQREMMSPEEKQIAEYKEKLSKYEKQEAEYKAQQENAQKEAVKQKYQADYHKQIVEALDTSGLPKTEYTVQRMIHYMSKALSAEYELSAKDVTDLVRRDYINDTKALYSGLDSDALISILGDDVAGKLRKADLAKIKQMQKGPVQNNSGVSTSSPVKKDTRMSKDEWRDMLDKIKD